MTDWHRENGYIRNHTIIASYELANYLHGRVYTKWKLDKKYDPWPFIEIGSALNELQFIKIKTEFVCE